MPSRGTTPPAVEALPATGAALLYAQSVHAGQTRRSDGAPFILHPLEVASLLHEAGAPDHLIAAGILHDTIEKTDASPGALRRRFGSKVATLVVAVTEDPGIGGYAGRKAALRAQVAGAGEHALMLFAADKAARVHELRVTRAATPQRRLAHYRSSLRMLEDRLPDSTLTTQLRDELARLAKRRRARRAAG